jgi:hypothetical protein
LRDLFAATFFLFFSFQLLPSDLVSVAGPALALTVVAVATKFLTARLATKRIGVGPRGQRRAGALAARGEFSIVVASLRPNSLTAVISRRSLPPSCSSPRSCPRCWPSWSTGRASRRLRGSRALNAHQIEEPAQAVELNIDHLATGTGGESAHVVMPASR